MVKPFARELENIRRTLEWAFAEPVPPILEKIITTLLDFPLLVVGSGGSLSCAHFIARLHEQATGKMCRAITPFELLFLDVNPSSHGILLITASGNNKDIINAVEVAIRKEFAQIAITCSSVGSKIAALSKAYPYICMFEYNNPTGKDGFLAVNTLLSTCVLFAKAYGAVDTAIEADKIQQIVDSRPDFLDESWDHVLARNTIVASGRASGWAIMNGFTEYFDHERVREAKSLSAKQSALHSALFGANNAIKNKVMEMVLDLTPMGVGGG